MVWLAVIALAIWVLVEHGRSTRLKQELAELRKRLAATPTPAPHGRRMQRGGPAEPARRRLRHPHHRTGDRRAGRPGPDARAGGCQPRASRAEPPRPPPVVTPRRASRRSPAPRSRRWLAERGLAWIGGSALVIGGAFLVGYAAQRGLLHPAMRIIAAILLGFALLGAGEAIRRGRLAGFGGHKLAAAVASGAGASVLYGATLGRRPTSTTSSTAALCVGPAGGDRLGPAGPGLPARRGAGGAGAGRGVRRAADGRRRRPGRSRR